MLVASLATSACSYWSSPYPGSAAPVSVRPASSECHRADNHAQLHLSSVRASAMRQVVGRIFAVLPMLDAVLFGLVVGPAGLDHLRRSPRRENRSIARAHRRPRSPRRVPVGYPQGRDIRRRRLAGNQVIGVRRVESPAFSPFVRRRQVEHTSRTPWDARRGDDHDTSQIGSYE